MDAVSAADHMSGSYRDSFSNAFSISDVKIRAHSYPNLLLHFNDADTFEQQFSDNLEPLTKLRTEDSTKTESERKESQPPIVKVTDIYNIAKESEKSEFLSKENNEECSGSSVQSDGEYQSNKIAYLRYWQNAANKRHLLPVRRSFSWGTQVSPSKGEHDTVLSAKDVTSTRSRSRTLPPKPVHLSVDFHPSLGLSSTSSEYFADCSDDSNRSSASEDSYRYICKQGSFNVSEMKTFFTS